MFMSRIQMLSFIRDHMLNVLRYQVLSLTGFSNLKTMKFFLIVFALFIVQCKNLCSQDTIPISIANNRFLIVEGLVNNSYKARFIIDTGAGLELVSYGFFDKIRDSATPAGILTGFQSIGTRVDLELYQISSLKIGNYEKRDLIIAPYSDLDNYTGIDGLVSLNFFKHQAFTFDFVTRKLVLETPGSINSIQERAENIPIYESNFADRSLDIFLPLIVNGNVKILTKFDTGTGIETMIHPYFLKALGINNLTDSASRRSYQNPDGSSQELSVFQIDSLSSVNSKLVEGNDLSANFLENFIYEGLIGWQLFKYKLITIDITNHRLLVRKNPVSIEIKPPYIIKMFPSPNATNVPTNIQEIYVEFNVDMSSSICIGVPDGSTGISYTNAYWKSGKILAIRIDGKLQSQTRYNISLGIRGMCQLMDNFGALLPVTQWSFNTK